MTTSLPRVISILVLAVGSSLSTSSSASASADPQFGQHVRTCAQVMGFDGIHNPGMHSGYAGWAPEHVC